MTEELKMEEARDNKRRCTSAIGQDAARKKAHEARDEKRQREKHKYTPMLREGAVKEGKPRVRGRALGPVPVSAAGCSESCCPVIRCRQTCWELWRLAWSMLE